MKRSAVITGGAGFIGSHLSRLLLENNYNVTVYDDFSNGSGKDNLVEGIKVVKGNILNSQKFKTACKRSDVVFHLAVKPLAMSFDRPEEVVRVNDYGTYLIAKICTELDIKLIHVSSSEAYGSAVSIPMGEDHPFFPSTIYASSKAASELYVRGFYKTYGLKMVIVRPFNSYGAYMRSDMYAAVIPKFYDRISNRLSPVIHGTGNQTRDFTYVEDTCKGIMLADETKAAIGNTFNIGQGKEVSVREIAKIMIKKYSEISGNEVNLAIKFDAPRKGDVMRHLANISRARRVLKYKPTISLEKGIEKYIMWALKKTRK